MSTNSRLVRLSGLFGCCLLAAFNVSTALAAPLTLKVDESKAFRAGTDPVEILLGDEMPSELVQYLHFEIDAIDVTEYVQRNAKVFQFTPQQPLTPGMHELRVVAVMPDGAIEETAKWSIEVRASSKFRVAEVNKQVNLMLMQRLATDLPQPLPAATQGQGTFAFSSRHADGDWTVTSSSNVLYNSQKALNPSGEELELAEYQVKADWARNSVVMGHQAISPGSLILNEFNRRGVSASHRSEKDRITMTGFATRTEEITGFRNFTGIEQQDNRTAGVVLTGYPFANKPQALAVSLVVVDSKGISQGAAEINDATAAAGGDARAVIVDHYHGNNVWQMRGEYADTSFDFDGVDTGFAAAQDNAHSVLVNYDTSRDTSGKDRKGRNWNFSVGHQRTGPWFFSHGNTAITPDRTMKLVSAGFQGKQFGLTGSVNLGEDNVLGDTSLPKTAIDAANFGIVYTPQSATTTAEDGQVAKPSKSIFRNPSYSLTYQRSSMDQIYAPAVFTGDDVNSLHQEVMAAVTSSGTDWNWTLSQSYIQQDDLVNASNKANTVTTSLEASMMLNKYTSFAPVLQQSMTKFTSVGTEVNSSAYGATVNLNYPQNWVHGFSYTVNRDVATDGSTDSTTRIAQLLVQWQRQTPVPGKFGINYFATASHQHSETSGDATDGYQVFVGLNISWPVAN